jgi:hypothetical protein
MQKRRSIGKIYTQENHQFAARKSASASSSKPIFTFKVKKHIDEMCTLVKKTPVSLNCVKTTEACCKDTKVEKIIKICTDNNYLGTIVEFGLMPSPFPGYDCIAKESGVVSINGANVFADIFTMERKGSFKKEPVIKRMVFDVSRFINNPGDDSNIPNIPVNSRDLREFAETYKYCCMPMLLEIILNMKVGNDTLMEIHQITGESLMGLKKSIETGSPIYKTNGTYPDIYRENGTFAHLVKMIERKHLNAIIREQKTGKTDEIVKYLREYEWDTTPMKEIEEEEDDDDDELIGW